MKITDERLAELLIVMAYSDGERFVKIAQQPVPAVGGASGGGGQDQQTVVQQTMEKLPQLLSQVKQILTKKFHTINNRLKTLTNPSDITTTIKELKDGKGGNLFNLQGVIGELNKSAAFRDIKVMIQKSPEVVTQIQAMIQKYLPGINIDKGGSPVTASAKQRKVIASILDRMASVAYDLDKAKRFEEANIVDNLIADISEEI